jgi:hypothetical protein
MQFFFALSWILVFLSVMYNSAIAGAETALAIAKSKGSILNIEVIINEMEMQFPRFISHIKGGIYIVSAIIFTIILVFIEISKEKVEKFLSSE